MRWERLASLRLDAGEIDDLFDLFGVVAHDVAHLGRSDQENLHSAVDEALLLHDRHCHHAADVGFDFRQHRLGRGGRRHEAVVDVRVGWRITKSGWAPFCPSKNNSLFFPCYAPLKSPDTFPVNSLF